VVIEVPGCEEDVGGREVGECVGSVYGPFQLRSDSEEMWKGTECSMLTLGSGDMMGSKVEPNYKILLIDRLIIKELYLSLSIGNRNLPCRS